MVTAEVARAVAAWEGAETEAVAAVAAEMEAGVRAEVAMAEAAMAEAAWVAAVRAAARSRR